jgi:urease accessory protein
MLTNRSFGAAQAMLTVAAGIFILPAIGNAHAIGTNAGGFLSGLEHPVFGPDHLLAMFAVGLWGAQIGGRSVWELPVAFPLIMTFGGTLGIMGIPFPYTEILIAASMIVLGLAVAFAWRPASWLSIAVVGAFAIFHGHAHGAELPSSANPLAYALGFVVATGLIHIAGIAFGLVLGKAMDGKVSRAAGAAIGLAGAYYLLA